MPRSSTHSSFKSSLLQEQVPCPSSAQQAERRAVGADHEVGAVVHVVARHRVARRGGAAAEDAAALEQHHLVPPLLECDRRREAREASSDDDDLHTPQ